MLRPATIVIGIFLGLPLHLYDYADPLKKIEVSDSYPGNRSISLTEQAYLLNSGEENVGLEDIRGYPSDRWTSTEGYRGIPAGKVWLQIPIEVKSLRNFHWYINLPSWAEYVELYYEIDNEIISSQTSGIRFPFSHRALEHRKNLFPITLREDSSASIFLYLENSVPIIDTFELVEASHFHIQDTKATAFLYLLFGCLVIMTLYNLFVFSSVREISYLFYSLQMGFMGLSLFSTYGFAYQWLWPDSPAFQAVSRNILLEISFFFSTLFCVHFLQVRTFSKVLARVLYVIAFSHLALISASFIPFVSREIALLYIMLTYCYYVLVGILAWRRNISAAPYYTFAWIGVVVAMCASLGVLVIGKYLDSIRSIPFLLIAVVIEALLLSFALAARIKSLQKLEIKEKNQFLALISHELRTPLNGIMGSLSLIDTPNKTTEDNESIHFLSQSANKLNSIVIGILNFTEGQKSRTLDNPSRNNLKGILGDISTELSEMSKRKDLFLSITKSPEIPDNLYFDRERLHTILFNLVENSIKFSDQGYVTVCITLLRKEGSLCYIRFSVRDSGIGIAQDELKVIFNTFKQSEQFYSREHEGLGLGLSLAAQNIAIMGSKICVTSTPNKGSHFYFDLNMREAEPNESAQDPNIDSTTLNILYVEDNTINQLVTKKLLEQNGYHVDIAENGRQGVDCVINNNYDLVLMDCSMPVMNGFEATKAIREAGYYDLPIIAVTANAMSGDKENCFKAGMNGYIAKPVNKHQLIETIENAWKNKRLKAS